MRQVDPHAPSYKIGGSHFRALHEIRRRVRVWVPYSKPQDDVERGNMQQASSSRLISGLIVALLLGSQAQRAAAQVVKGSISGTVLDVHAAVIPGASVEATNQSTGEQYTTVTDQTGLFHLALVSIGTYNVAISKDGFKTLTLDSVIVQASQDAGLGSLT